MSFKKNLKYVLEWTALLLGVQRRSVESVNALCKRKKTNKNIHQRHTLTRQKFYSQKSRLIVITRKEIVIPWLKCIVVIFK